jgi:heptosyltransferase-2
LIPAFVGIKKRSGFLGEQRWGLINDVRKLDKKKLPLTVQRFVALADHTDTAIRAIPKPEFRIHEADRQKALYDLGIQSPDQPVLALCPGAEYGPAKQWPASHFAELARKKANSGYHVWLFGSPKDQGFCKEIVQLSRVDCLNLAGLTSLSQAIDLLSLASIGVTNDSGLMHILAALKVPLVAIYGSSTPEFTPPLGDNAQTVSLGLSCSPCFKRNCPLGHLNCLNKLSAQMVFEAIDKLDA